MPQYTCFATFGCDNLKNFDVNPMKIMLVAEDESQLRLELLKPPFNGKFCTTYPISYAEEMKREWNMYEITMEDLMKLYRGL